MYKKREFIEDIKDYINERSAELIVAGYMLVWVILLVITLTVTSSILDKKSKTTFQQAVVLAEDTDYRIYLNGALQDSATFNISLLNTSNYNFTINEEEKTISITQKR